MSTPYNTGKLKIGATYIPPIKNNLESEDSIIIQRALIAKKTLKTISSIDFWFVRIVILLSVVVALIINVKVLP